MGFSIFNFQPRIQRAIQKSGFTVPTPIQSQAIPVILAGGDVMGLAQTGTGKTAAFVLPMLENLAKHKVKGVLRAVILAPTRELAQQIHEVVLDFGDALGLRSMTAYGGTRMNSQIRELRQGVDIIVGCPGRVLDHIERGTVRLKDVSLLVLDEADQMFDMGFLPTVRRILKSVPKERQTLLFSATMPSAVAGLAQDILRNPQVIKIGEQSPVSTVAHAIYPVSQNLKSPLLIELLRNTDTDSVLVFTRTKHRAKRVSVQLKEAGFKATSLQGNLSQGQRQIAMKGFRSGAYQILVATDIAARGIDISTISHVINYDMPDTVEAYTHRIGRTGRAAKTGDAYTLVSPEDLSLVRAIERVLGSELERKTLEGFTLNMPALSAPSPGAQRPFSRRRNFGSRFGGGGFSRRSRGGSFRGSQSRAAYN